MEGHLFLSRAHKQFNRKAVGNIRHCQSGQTIVSSENFAIDAPTTFLFFLNRPALCRGIWTKAIVMCTDNLQNVGTPGHLTRQIAMPKVPTVPADT